MKKVLKISIFTMLLVIVLTGCGSLSGSSEEDLSLRIGLMPAVDSAPIFLAEEKGYFEELGLDMNIEIYTNAMNRQSALQSGELDGAMTDLIAFVNNIENGLDIKITTSTDGSFPFLVNRDFEEKENIVVGMMEVSVSNFLSDLYLGEAYTMEKVFVNEIPARLEMIKTGQMDMASIPEPMASMGQLSGLEKRVYESDDEFMPEAMVFTGKALKEKEKAIELFHQAFNKAVKDIKEDDGLARDVLIKKLELNPEIRDMITLPEYYEARIPSEEYLNKVISWVEDVQGNEINVPYDTMIEGKFVQ